MFVCFYARHAEVMKMHSHALQEQKSHTNKHSMQNSHFVSRPKFHVLSNGALVFEVSLILCIRKIY
jgi:hypothetical protein